jgi:hypothetical protein
VNSWAELNSVVGHARHLGTAKTSVSMQDGNLLGKGIVYICKQDLELCSYFTRALRKCKHSVFWDGKGRMRLILCPEPHYEMADPIRHKHETQGILKGNTMRKCVAVTFHLPGNLPWYPIGRRLMFYQQVIAEICWPWGRQFGWHGCHQIITNRFWRQWYIFKDSIASNVY